MGTPGRALSATSLCWTMSTPMPFGSSTTKWQSPQGSSRIAHVEPRAKRVGLEHDVNEAPNYKSAFYGRHVFGMPCGCVWSGISGDSGSPPRVYAKGIAQLFGCDSHNDILGLVTPGTALAVGQADAGNPESDVVRISGWTMEGASSVIYEAPDLRIKLATLSRFPGSCLTIDGSQTDPYGNKWQRVTISGRVEKRGVVADVRTVWRQASKLYAAKCSRCHGLHHPSQFTANQWPGILQTMAKNAGLQEEQKALIEKYLQTHARAIE